MQRNATLEADIIAIRGMRLMFEAGVELSRQVWLDQAGYRDFTLLTSSVHDGRYRWRVRFEDSSSALDARGDAALAARLWALIGDCILEPLIWSLYSEVASGDADDERPGPPIRNDPPILLSAPRQ